MSDPSPFTPGKRAILWFSRGRGRGHAIPDIEIIRALQQQGSDCEVRIVSYGTGARTFESFGYGVIDLGLSDAGEIADVI